MLKILRIKKLKPGDMLHGYECAGKYVGQLNLPEFGEIECYYGETPVDVMESAQANGHVLNGFEVEDAFFKDYVKSVWKRPSQHNKKKVA